MKRYDVMLPITGHVFVTVEAENEKEAIERALETNFSDDDIVHWQTHKAICTGNVLHADINNASAEESGE